VVTFTANCWFYRIFWAVIWASWEFFWAGFMRTLGWLFNQHLAALNYGIIDTNQQPQQN